jgi:hypothetical protein
MTVYDTYHQHKRKFKDSQAYFVVCELPTLLFLAIIGFIIEFLIELPFMLICLLDHQISDLRRTQRREESPSKRHGSTFGR